MLFAMGPTPDRELLDSRPDDVSFEAAVGAWHAAYSDARNDRAYHVFPPDTHVLQEFYEDGYLRGQRDKLHMKRINERIPRESSAAPDPEFLTPSVRLRVALERAETLHKHLLGNSELVKALATTLVAAAILVRGHR